MREARECALAAAACIVAGPSTAAFGKQNQRHAPMLRDINNAVRFAVILLSLRASEHGVIVRHHRTTRHRLWEPMAVDAPNPRDEPIGWAFRNQFLHRAPTVLRRQHQLPILDKRACITQRLNVLTRGALPFRASSRHRFGSRRIERDVVTVQHFFQIGTNLVKVADLGRRDAIGCDLARLDEQHRMILIERVTFCGCNASHDAALRRCDLMLHLHCFHDEQQLSRAHRIAFLHFNCHNQPLQWGLHNKQPLRFSPVVVVRTRRLLRRFAISQHRQRVIRVNLRASPLTRVARLRQRDVTPLVCGCGIDERGQVVCDEICVELRRAELRLLQHVLQKRHVRRRAIQTKFTQCAIGARHHILEARLMRMGNHFRQQRIEARVRAIASITARVHANARSRRRLAHG